MVPNLGHPMIRRKDENRFLVPIEPRNETFGPFHDVIYNFYVFHVFLVHRESDVSYKSPVEWRGISSLVNVVDVSDR